MRAVLFIVGLLVGLVCGMAGLISLRDEISTEFAKKSFRDDKEDFVSVSGTLTGEIEFPNNSCSIACYRGLNQCWIACVQAISGSLLGPITAPFFYEIQSWTANEIVAASSVSSGALIACYRTTIKIERPTERVLWDEQPVNQTNPICKGSENKSRKSSIEDAPRWKNIFLKKN